MAQWVLKAPLKVPVGKKGKEFTLNLNIYRNTYYQTLNQAKIAFKEHMLPQIKSLPKFNKIIIRYQLVVPTKRLCDVSNICCIVDKFFSDALVEAGKLPDDNYKHVLGVSYEFSEVNKEDPCVWIQIEEM